MPVPAKFVEAFGFAAATSSIALAGCYSADLADGSWKAVVVAAADVDADADVAAASVVVVAASVAASASAVVTRSFAFVAASDFAFVPKIAAPHRPYSHTSPYH